MATLFTFGLAQINYKGTKVGMVYKDTCKLTQDAADVTEHYEEGKAIPALSSKEKKTPKLEFSIMNPDAKFLADHLGGTYDSTDKSWAFDGSETVDPDEWEVITKKGMDFRIPKGDAEVTVEFDISDKSLLLVKFVVTPLTPDDPSEKPFIATEKA
jgi:hypothetical protein